MTAQDIYDFLAERRDAISRAGLVRINEMLVELPIEEISDVRSWVMEGVALIVNDPLYKGDIASFE